MQEETFLLTTFEVFYIELIILTHQSPAILFTLTLTLFFEFLGLEGMAYTKQEKLTRCKLAAVYRLIDMYGWTQGIYNHVTVRTILLSSTFWVTL